MITEIKKEHVTSRTEFKNALANTEHALSNEMAAHHESNLQMIDRIDGIENTVITRFTRMSEGQPPVKEKENAANGRQENKQKTPRFHTPR